MDPRTALLQQETDDSKGFRNKSIGMHNLRAKLREQLKGYSHVRGFPLEPEYKRDAADSLTARRDSIRRRNSSVTKQQETESADEPKYKPRRLRKKQESLLVPRLLWFSVYLSLCFVAFKGMKYFTSETEVKLCQPCSGECGVLDEEFTIPVDSLGDLPFGTVFPRQSNLQCRSSMCVPGYVADPNALCRVVSDEALLYHTRRLLSAEDSLDDNNERFLAYFKSRALAETGIAGALSPTGSPVVPTPAATTRPTPAATTTPIPATTSTPTPAATTPATPAATTRPTPTVTTTPTPAITIPSITIPSIPSLTPRPGTPSNTPSSTPGGFLQPTTRQPSSDDNRPGSPGSNGGNQGQGGDRGGSPEGNRPGSPGSNGGNQGQGGDRGGKSTEEQNTRSSDGTPSGRTTENRDSGSQPSRTFEGPTSTPAATTAGRSSEDQSTRTPPAETPTPSSTATPPTSSGTPPPTPDAGTPPPTSGTPPPTGTPPPAQAPSPSANDGLLSAGAYYNDPNLPWATGAEGGAGGNCNTLQYAPMESNGYANLTTTYYRGIRNVQNYAQCCGICANDPNCAGWVRVAGGDPSVMNCYLKSSLTMDANAGASAYNWQPTDARWPPNPAVRYTGGVPIMFESGTMGTPLPQIMYGCPYPPTADGSCTPPAGCNCGGGVCHGPCLAPSATSRSAQTPSSSL